MVIGALSTVKSLREGLFLRNVPTMLHADGVFRFLCLFAFPLDAGVWRSLLWH